MGRIKHPPLRNKIILADRAIVRAWTRRLDVSLDTLKVVVDKLVIPSQLQRARHQASPVPTESTAAKDELATPV